MPVSDEYIQYVLEQMAPAGEVYARKMFGEYGLYMDGKIMGLVCDNHVFLKKTSAGAKYLGEDPLEGYAYPGARLSYIFDDLDDTTFVCQVMRATWEELPFPKQKNKK